MAKSRKDFQTVGVPREYHYLLRRVAALEAKKIFEVLIQYTEPILQKRLAKLNARAAK